MLNFHSGPCINSATMAGVTNTTKHVVAYNGRKYQLTGIHGQAGKAHGCTVGFPTVTDKGKQILICTTHSLLADDTHENLLSLAQLLLNGYSITFAAGRDSDQQYGGQLTTPSGQKITLIFHNNLWRLPLWAPATKTHTTKRTNHPPPVTDNNPYTALLTISDPDEHRGTQDVHARHLHTCTLPELLHVSQQMQVLCNKWCHPGSTKHMENFKWYRGKGFPSDFPTLINNWGCQVCSLMKGTLQYSVKDKPKTDSPGKLMTKPKSAQTPKVTVSLLSLPSLPTTHPLSSLTIGMWILATALLLQHTRKSTSSSFVCSSETFSLASLLRLALPLSLHFRISLISLGLCHLPMPTRHGKR
jgi:hypothetical protein